jgi:ABC-type oligopeptide transport system substrate-binding subunit
MNRRTKKIIKKLTASILVLGSIGGISTAVTLSLLKEKSTADFYVSVEVPYTSLNYNKTNERKNPNVSSIFQNSIDGFFFNNGNGNGEFNVLKVLGYTQASFSVIENNDFLSTMSEVNSETQIDPLSKYESNASEYYLSLSSSVSKNPVYVAVSKLSDNDSAGFIDYYIDIKENARWENGEEVGAEDFIDSVRLAINPKNQSVIYNEGAEIYGYNSCRTYLSTNNIDLDDIWEDVVVNKDEKYADNCGKLFNEGIVPTKINRLPTEYVDTMSESYSQSLNNKDSKSLVKNHSIRYRFAVPNTSGSAFSLGLSFLQSFTKKQIFYPVNRRFINSIDGGYFKFGTSKETFISNGPFYIDDADFDYEIYFKKNPYFWDRDRVLSDSYKVRVIKDTSAAQTQFKIGKIDNININPELYNTLSKDVNIGKLIKRGSSAASTRGFAFNTYGPASKYTQNPYLRNAIKFAIDRRKLVSAYGVKGTIPSYTFSTTYENSSQQFKTTNGAGFDSYLYKLDENNIQKPLSISVNYEIDENEFTRDLPFSSLESKTFSPIVASYEQIDREQVSKDYDFDPQLATYFLNKFYETSGYDKDKVINLKLLFINSGTEKTQAVTFKRQVEKNLNFKVNIELVAKPVQTLTLEKNGFYDNYDIVYRESQDDLGISAFNLLRLLMIKPDKNSSKNLSDISVIGNTTIFNPYDEKDPTSILGFWKSQAESSNMSLSDFFNKNFGLDLNEKDLDDIKNFISQWILSLNNTILNDYSDLKPTENKNSVLIRKDMEINSEIVKNTVVQSTGMPNIWYNNLLEYSTVQNILSYISENTDDTIKQNMDKITLSKATNLSDIRNEAILADDIFKILVNIEKISKISSPVVLTFQTAQTYYASNLLNASGSSLFPTGNGYSFRHSYKCSNPPKHINKFIPGCEARVGNEVVIGE